MQDLMRRCAPYGVTGLALLLTGWLAVVCHAESVPEAPQKSHHRISLHPSPNTQPETTPVRQNPGGGASTSVDATVTRPDPMLNFEVYNAFPRELDLWGLESKRMIRSLPVISPDKTVFAYTEVMFIPNIRQTYSRLYQVPVQPPDPPPQPRLPSEEVKTPAPPPVDPAIYAKRFDPDHTLKIRQILAGVGNNRVKPYDFKTLTIVDWSASGQRLLFKERNGVLHVGLRISDLLVYDQGKGVVAVYPEIHRIIQHYWATQGNLPYLNTISWDLQPLGWAPGSDSVILLKAWAYDQKEKKFLGLWQYDVDAERTQLLHLQDEPIAVAANGWIATPKMPLRQNSAEPTWKDRLRHPFAWRQTPVPGASSKPE